jgi:tetratricopeptide (TPR) repeat protein
MPPDEQLQAITSLNANRNNLETLVNQSFFLCIPEHLLPLFVIHAPDLFSIRSGIFRFLELEMEGIDEYKGVIQMMGDIQTGWTDIQGLTISERENIITRLRERLVTSDIKSLEQANISNLLAEYLYSFAKYQEAEPLYRKALEIREEILEKKNSDIAESLNNLAVLLYSKGRYQEAEPLYRRALEIREETLGEKHPDMARSLNNLSAFLHSTDRYHEAESLLRRALEIREETLGEKHPDIANSLNNLANLYYNTGRYQEAEPLYGRALEIWKEILGENHPNFAQGLDNLANLLYSTGRYQEAEPLYKKALEIFFAFTDFVHPSLPMTFQNWLGCLQEMQEKGLFPYEDEGENAKVRELKERAEAFLNSHKSEEWVASPQDSTIQCSPYEQQDSPLSSHR